MDEEQIARVGKLIRGIAKSSGLTPYEVLRAFDDLQMLESSTAAMLWIDEGEEDENPSVRQGEGVE